MEKNKNQKKNKLFSPFEKAWSYIRSNRPFAVVLVLLIAASAYVCVNEYGSFRGKLMEQTSVYQNAVKIEFKDKNFEHEIRNLLKRSSGDIYDTDLATIGKMTIQNVPIKDVSELSYFTGLRYLEISSGKLHDLTPLSSLDGLLTLKLSSNVITDVTPLAGCASLEYLDLSQNEITDMSPLYGLKNLVQLNLSNNTISDVSPQVAQMSSLVDLNLTRNRQKDNSVFSGMAKLQKLNLTYNKLTEIKPLKGMTSLRELSYENNALVKIDTLGEMPVLEKLTVSANNLTEIGFASQYPWLKELSCNENEISSLEPLRNNTALECLRIQHTKVQDLTVLQQLPKFNSIYLDTDFDRTKIRFLRQPDGTWKFRNGDKITKQYVLNDRYGFESGKG